MTVTTTQNYSRIRYFTSPSERPGEVFPFILGGSNNCIFNDSNTSAIGGGDQNIIGSQTGSQPFSFIGAGRFNCIEGVGTMGVIGGGCRNTVSGAYSSILGGKGNTVSHNYAGAFGNGLVSCSADTFHVSCLNAVNTPIAGIQPAGSYVYKLNCNLLPLDKVIVMR